MSHRRREPRPCRCSPPRRAHSGSEVLANGAKRGCRVHVFDGPADADRVRRSGRDSVGLPALRRLCMFWFLAYAVVAVCLSSSCCSAAVSARRSWRYSSCVMSCRSCADRSPDRGSRPVTGCCWLRSAAAAARCLASVLRPAGDAAALASAPGRSPVELSKRRPGQTAARPAGARARPPTRAREPVLGIVGELRNLSIAVSATAVRKLLKAAGLPPAPQRDRLSWTGSGADRRRIRIRRRSGKRAERRRCPSEGSASSAARRGGTSRRSPVPCRGR